MAGRHRPKWTCIACGRRRVPAKGAICYDCRGWVPGAPADDDDDERPTRPVAGAGRSCRRCGSAMGGNGCPACGRSQGIRG
jgi:hypothetical protein